MLYTSKSNAGSRADILSTSTSMVKWNSLKIFAQKNVLSVRCPNHKNHSYPRNTTRIFCFLKFGDFRKGTILHAEIVKTLYLGIEMLVSKIQGRRINL